VYKDYTVEKYSRNGTESATKPVSREDPIPFELPPDVPLPDSESSSYSAQGEETSIDEGTITPKEREIFGNIFQEIAQRQRRRGKGPVKAVPAPPGKLLDNTERASGLSVVNIIVKRAAEDYESKGGVGGGAAVASLPDESAQMLADSLFASGSAAFTASDRSAALRHFPTSLRRAAEEAFGASRTAAESVRESSVMLAESEVIEESARRPDLIVVDPEAERIEAMRIGEQHRVEALMTAAKTDFELWDIMEQEVFPLVDKFSIDSSSKPVLKTRKRPSNAEALETHTSAADRERRYNMALYGLLYPSHLLCALRLLDSAFPRPSPLALSILPRIKQLGVASYVLGASTAFYNALMGIHWYRYGNIGAVFDLLEEMRHSGLTLNSDTMGIVMDAENSLRPCAEGSDSPFLEELTAMPEYEPAIQSLLHRWGWRIQNSIDDSQAG
jgi:hypothetical protein